MFSRRKNGQSYVQLFFPQKQEHLRSGNIVKMQLDLGILLAEHFESSWKYLGSRRWSIAHVKLSDSSLDPRFRASNCFLGMPQQRPRFFKEFSTGNGQAECLGTPLKQPDRDFVFKITNLPADRWLRNVQPQGCA
jgi:hypothetical protein